MQGRNYTNPEDRGRFGFSASGKFNAPYKLGSMIIAVVTAAAIVAVILIVIAAVKIMRTNFTGVDSGRVLEALITGGATIVIVVLLLAVTVFVAKFVNDGFRCSYIADEEKFTAEIGGTHRTIYYKEVQSVHFHPRSFMGKVRGYDVTVKVNGVNEEFSIVSSGYISEKSTPFYIIKERVESLRYEEEMARDLEKTLSAGGVSNQSLGGSLSEKRSEMPGVSAAGVKRDIPSMPAVGISRDVPPDNSRASVMPAVGISADNTGNIIRQDSVYTDIDGIERRVNDIVAQGTFCEAVKPVKAVLISAVGIIVYVVISVFFYVFMENKFSSFGALVSLLVVVIAAPFYFGTIINFLRNGAEYRYSANGREFVIYSKGKSDEHILYSDVQSVDYKPFKILWIFKGFKVEILTRYGVLKYNYVLPGRVRTLNTQNLPFEEIRKRIGNRRDM